MPSSLLVIGAGILLVAITVLTYRRIHLSKDLDELTAKIRQAFAEAPKSAQPESSTTRLDENLAMRFEGQVLTAALQEAFTNRLPHSTETPANWPSEPKRDTSHSRM